MKSYKEWYRLLLKMESEPRRMGFQQGAWYYWEIKSGTVPVKARSYLGIKDDRAYMLVEGSETGVPLDECRMLDPEMWPSFDKGSKPC